MKLSREGGARGLFVGPWSRAVGLALGLGVQVVGAQPEPDLGASQAAAICAPWLKVALPSPPPSASENPKDCDETALYYGFAQPADPASALQCGWAQRQHPDRTRGDPAGGPGVLSMLYANGVGVPRNIDLALRFVCENPWAAEGETLSRIDHLQAMRQESTGGKPFDLCDDVTSGLTMGYCARIDSRRADVQRAAKLAAVEGQWTTEVREAFIPLQSAEAVFAGVRSDDEVDRSGTARAAFALEERDRLKDQELINLHDFAAGAIPKASAREAVLADQEMAALLDQLAKPDAFENGMTGTVTLAGIHKTQDVWLAARAAWLQFGAIAYPRLDPERIRCRLTRQRIHQLRSLLAQTPQR